MKKIIQYGKIYSVMIILFISSLATGIYVPEVSILWAIIYIFSTIGSTAEAIRNPKSGFIMSVALSLESKMNQTIFRVSSIIVPMLAIATLIFAVMSNAEMVKMLASLGLIISIISNELQNLSLLKSKYDDIEEKVVVTKQNSENV